MMWFVGWPRVNNKQTNKQIDRQTNQVISNVTLMRNMLAHVFGLWKLAINLHCILAGTMSWQTQRTICFLLNSRVSVFLWGLHSSPCKNKARKDSRVKFSQDNICFADCFPETGCHPEARAFGSQQVLTLHLKSLSWSLKNYDLYFSFLDTRADPPEMKTTVCSVFPNTAGSARISHLKLFNTWLTYFWTPPVDCHGLV